MRAPVAAAATATAATAATAARHACPPCVSLVTESLFCVYCRTCTIQKLSTADVTNENPRWKASGLTKASLCSFGRADIDSLRFPLSW